MKRGILGACAAVVLALSSGGVAYGTTGDEGADGVVGAPVDAVIGEVQVAEEVAAPGEEVAESTEEATLPASDEDVGAPVEEGVPPTEEAVPGPDTQPVVDGSEDASEDPATRAPGQGQSGLVGEAEEVSGTLGEITREGCKVYIPTSTVGAGEFSVIIWDDGESVATISWTMTGSGTHTAVWTITQPAGTGAPGVGIELVWGSESLDEVDPFLYPDDVAESCYAETPVVVTLPGYDPAAGVQPGDALPIAGSGFLAGESVEARLFSTGALLGTFVAAGDGTFSGTGTIPSDSPLGLTRVVGDGLTSGRTGEAAVKLVAPPEEVSATILEPSRDGCKVTIPVQSTGAGDFELKVRDDGVVIDTFTWTMTASGLHNVVWTITKPAGTEAPGVGFSVYVSGGERLDRYDPFEYPAEVADGCSAQVPVTLLLPDVPGAGVVAGSDVKATGSGYLPGEDVALVFGPDAIEVGTFVAGADGTFTGTFKVPVGAAPGDYFVVSHGAESGRSAKASLRVIAAVVPTTPVVDKKPVPELAKTGVNSADLALMVGMGLLALGGSALAVSRRKRS